MDWGSSLMGESEISMISRDAARGGVSGERDERDDEAGCLYNAGTPTCTGIAAAC